MKVVLATRNQGKIVELRRILGDVDVVGLEEYPRRTRRAGDRADLRGQRPAQGAGVAAHRACPPWPTTAGLCVDALNGMPGVFSARWAGRHGDDEANLDLLLGQLSDVRRSTRGARFVCVAAVAWPSGEEQMVEGQLTGRVIDARRGANGFGYDPIFVPDGETRTTAELSPDEKDAISHRGKAFRALADRLRQTTS